MKIKFAHLDQKDAGLFTRNIQKMHMKRRERNDMKYTQSRKKILKRPEKERTERNQNEINRIVK